MASSSHPQQHHRIALVRLPEFSTPCVEAVQSFLESHHLTWDVLESISVDALAPYDLVVVPGWKDEDHTFYYALKVYAYRGGRLLGCGWGNDFWAKALISWLWDADVLESEILTTEDHTAVYLSGPDLLGEVFEPAFRSLLSSKRTLPDRLSSRTYPGKKAAWEVRGESFYLNGEPVLLRGVGTLPIGGSLSPEAVEQSLATYRDLNLNFVLPYSRYNANLDAFENALDLIRRYKMHAVVWIGGPPGHFIARVAAYSEKPLRDEWWLRHLRYKNHPALLGWNMCDDTFDRYDAFLERTHRVIKKYDAENALTLTLMDPRHPEQLPHGAFQKWIDRVDYPMTYLYPLQKDDIYGAVDIEGGLEDLQRLIANTQRIWKKPVYIQIWCQAHMQGVAYGRVGLGPGETFLPSPEQQRLMTIYILQSGARGIVYFNSSSILDEHLGMGRRNEIGILWHELSPIETLIAGGVRTPLETNQEQVEATAYTRNGETAILLSKHIPKSNRYVSDGEVRNLILTLPKEAGRAFYHLQFPNVQQLAVTPVDGRLQIHIPRFDLTALVLATPDPDRPERVRDAYRAKLGCLSRMALEVLIDKRAKTEVVLDHLPPNIRDVHLRLVQQGERICEQAIRAYLARNERETYTLCRQNLSIYRTIEASVMQTAEASIEDRDLSLEQKRHTNIYFSLPRYYASLNAVPDIEPGQLKAETRRRLKTLLSQIPGAEKEG